MRSSPEVSGFPGKWHDPALGRRKRIERQEDHWLYRFTPEEWLKAARHELVRATRAFGQGDRRKGLFEARRAQEILEFVEGVVRAPSDGASPSTRQ
jgi:hypothetical protein